MRDACVANAQFKTILCCWILTIIGEAATGDGSVHGPIADDYESRQALRIAQEVDQISAKRIFDIIT